MRERLRAEVWGSDMDRYVLRHPVVEIDRVLVDAEAFFTTTSGCDRCGNCCRRGTTIPAATAQALAPHLHEIAERYLPAGRRHQVGWKFSADWDLDLTHLVAVDEHTTGCCFLYRQGEHYLCSIYSWAVATGRELYRYWPFECIMYPLAILPYRGILHPGKDLLTLRRPESAHIVDVYGDHRPLERSPLRRVLRELRQRVRRKLQRLGLARATRPAPGDCYFQDLGVPKAASYVYFADQIRWHYGEPFYRQLCQVAATWAQPPAAGNPQPPR
ncbi:MAG: hypothetical protein U1E76_13410 [Planctomycetota bacterium]